MPSPTIHIDPILLRQIAQGNASAFKTLFDHYFDLVYSTALRYTVIRQQAEDAAQQVFMRLWENRAELPEIQHLEPYLFTAAKREILQYFRKQIVRQDYVQHVMEVFSEIHDMHTPEAEMISAQSAEIYEQLVSGLSPRQQEAFRKSREQGLTYAQIAREMNVSKDTVKEYIGIALQHIRTYVQQHPDLMTLLPLLLLY